MQYSTSFFFNAAGKIGFRPHTSFAKFSGSDPLKLFFTLLASVDLGMLKHRAASRRVFCFLQTALMALSMYSGSPCCLTFLLTGPSFVRSIGLF